MPKESKNEIVKPPPLVMDGEAILESVGDLGETGMVDPKTLNKDVRRSAVAILYASAWRPASMARRLEVSKDTIYSDIKAIKRAASEDISGVTIREIAGGVNLRYEFLYRKAIESMMEIEDPVERLKAINQAMAIQKAQIDTLSKLGFQVGENDKAHLKSEVQQKTMVYVGQLMVVMEKHVDENRRMELAEDFQKILDSADYEVS